MASGDLSLTSNSSQEESPEYVSYASAERAIRPSSNSSGSTGNNNNLTNQNMNNNNNSSNPNNNNVTNKKYDIIKQQYDQAMLELSTLRRQHTDTIRRCEEMASRLGFYKEQYMAAMNQLETSAEERNKYTDVSNENDRLSQQNMLLERKLRRFIESVKQQENKDNNNQGFSTFYSEHYGVLGSVGGSTGSGSNIVGELSSGGILQQQQQQKCDGGCFIKYEKIIEEAQLCKKLYSDLSQERSAIALERDTLRMQLSSALTDLDNAKREYKIFRDAKDQLITQQEKEIEEIRSLMDARANELLMTKYHRNRVKEELNQILSEKDNVLQEHQKMSDDLLVTKKELEQKIKDELKLINEMKIMQQTNDELRTKLEQTNLMLEKRELLKSRDSAWSKDFNSSNGGGNSGGVSGDPKSDENSKEMEKLRKSLEKARTEVDKAVQETEIAKSRRDWAINEREKIVQERDSVKILCDELRRERDKAVSDLLSAIRDSEEIKKQKDEAQKKIETLKEHIETHGPHNNGNNNIGNNSISCIGMGSIAGGSSNTNTNISSRQSFRWSSYDMPDDIIEIELINYHIDQDIGIIIDDTNNRQIVCGITNISPAFGKLKINDIILKVNQLDCSTISKRKLYETIRTSAPHCTLLISRTKPIKRHLYTVHLNIKDNHHLSHGLNLETGIFISKIEQNSLANFEPELDIGDRVLSINNKSMQSIQTIKEAMKILDDQRNDAITIVALKNIQDFNYNNSTGDVLHNLRHIPQRMITKSAQTDSNDSMHKMIMSSSIGGSNNSSTTCAQQQGQQNLQQQQPHKQQSKISEMINKFREKIHITKSNNSNSGSGGGGGGSDIGGGGANGDNFSQENDALAALDSVLSENSEKSKENLFKRNKRNSSSSSKKDTKDSNKSSMGTWPRATFLNTSQENPTGTIVHHRKKERATLSLFTGGNGGTIQVDKQQQQQTTNLNNLDQKLLNKHNSPVNNSIGTNIISGITSTTTKNQNRNSNPIPTSLFQIIPSNAYLHRHSVYATSNLDSDQLLEQQQQLPPPHHHPKPILQQHQTISRNSHINPANLRLKIPPTDVSNNNNNNKYGTNQRYHHYSTTNNHHHHQNRLSLNLTSTDTNNFLMYKSGGQQAQQQVLNHQQQQINSIDFIPKKQQQQQSIDSIIMNQQQQQHHHHSNSSGQQNHPIKMPYPSPNLDYKLHQSSIGNSGSVGGNITNFSNSQQQQKSLDMISLKSQNSIDSFLSAQKSPTPGSHDYPNSLNYPPTKQQQRPIPIPGSGGTKFFSKYPSDSESIGMETMIMSSPGHTNSNNQLPPSLYFPPNLSSSSSSSHHRHATVPPHFPPPPSTTSSITGFSSHIHSHSHKIRHSSPLTLPASNSIEHNQQGNLVNSSSDKFDLDFPTNNHHSQQQQHQQHHHAYNSSIDYPYNRNNNNNRALPTRDHDIDIPTSQNNQNQNFYEGGTFPRKKEHQRFRIPSNPSVTSKGSGVKNSTGSIDHHGGVGGSGIGSAGGGGGGSERGSPMPPVHVEILSHGNGSNNKRNSTLPDFLCPGDLRRVTIDKSDKPLGITIQCNNNGFGIFVSTVAENSIASRAGLQIGDQLLEVCGLNMRAATNDIAANVLRQCGNSITMLVQYNPDKYDGHHNLEPEIMNHSGSPTPRNSPRPPARSIMLSSPPQSSTVLTTSTTVTNNNNNIINTSSSSTSFPKSSALISTPIKNEKFSDSLENQSDQSSHPGSSGSIFEEDPRYITFHTHKCKNLGIKLFGGNKVGIFVHDVQPDSPPDLAGVRKGDQILEYNGVNLRCVTAEQAANEISKLTDTVTLLVQNNIQKLNQIQDETGDSFYIRVGFDRTGELNEGELRFLKDEVLYVDNTIFRGAFGQWRAWKLDAYGLRKDCGIIPSQSKVEEELRLLGDSVDCDGGTARRGSTSARRSFFRRKKHQRSSSRDSKELASFSNTQLSYFSDSGMLNDDGGILSYQRVERLDYPACRPVLVLGPLAECVTDRLTLDFPLLFQHAIMTQMDCSQDTMEQGLQKYIFVDYRRKSNKYEWTTVESIRNIGKNNRHCILDMCISAVERLQRLQIYPIVLLLRFKSAKQIKEIKDSRYSTDKISAKAAKEMYERALKLESDYKQYISAVIPASVNIRHMSTQIKAFVVEEQSKVLWVPAT